MFGDFGCKETKKQKKQRILRENIERGKRGELKVKVSIGRFGDKVTKQPYGPDFKVERREIFTGKVTKEFVEVKTGKAKLSPLQRKIRKKRKFKVERV